MKWDTKPQIKIIQTDTISELSKKVNDFLWTFNNNTSNKLVDIKYQVIVGGNHSAMIIYTAKYQAKQ